MGGGGGRRVERKEISYSVHMNQKNPKCVHLPQSFESVVDVFRIQ